MIDITHGIAPRQVLQGALVLADTLAYLPAGVHVAVVDPGVGGERRALLLRGRDRVYVGPDNGLLLLAAERLGGIEQAVELTNEHYFLHPVSRTFHGRDVFSPVAAHVALGVGAEELGPSLAVEDLRRLDVPSPEVARSLVRATVLSVDRYGNVQLSAARADVERAGIGPRAPVEVVVGTARRDATVASTFADVEAGELVLYEDAYRRLALAVNGGNAAETLAARPGVEVEVSEREA